MSVSEFERVAYDDDDVRAAIRHFLRMCSQIGVALPTSILYKMCRSTMPGLIVGEYNMALNGMADEGFIGYHKGLVMSGMILKSAWDGEADS